MSITTEVDVANRALARIGSKTVLTASLDPSSSDPENAACAYFWEIVRDELLTAYPWWFATNRAALSVVTPAVARPEWAYAYNLPDDDVLAVQYLYSGARPGLETASQRVPFALEFDFAAAHLQTILLTDVSPATLVYTSKAALGAWPNYFADA